MNDQQKKLHFRMGEAKDALDIAHYYNMANQGLSEAWWSKQKKEGETWQEAFARDIMLPQSIAHYARAVICECDNQIVGLLIAFPQMPLPPVETFAALPSSEKNLLELRRLVERTMFIAIVAVHPDYQNRGIARHFVNLSMSVAETSGLTEASIIIHESNKQWLASFLRRGFIERARMDVGDHAVYPTGSEWVLVTRPVTPSSKKEGAAA